MSPLPGASAPWTTPHHQRADRSRQHLVPTLVFRLNSNTTRLGQSRPTVLWCVIVSVRGNRYPERSNIASNSTNQDRPSAPQRPRAGPLRGERCLRRWMGGWQSASNENLRAPNRKRKRGSGAAPRRVGGRTAGPGAPGAARGSGSGFEGEVPEPLPRRRGMSGLQPGVSPGAHALKHGPKIGRNLGRSKC